VSSVPPRASQAVLKSPRRPRLLLIADYDVVSRELINGRLGDGTPIPVAKIRDLACQSEILPAIFKGVSQPLDLGRSRRAASPAQRIALVARDKACVGCGANANWCQSHHIIPWAVHGNTDIDDMCLLCSRCHHKVHDDHWQVRKKPTGQYHLKPPPKPLRQVLPGSWNIYPCSVPSGFFLFSEPGGETELCAT